MDLTVVQEEVTNWAPEDQDRLAAYLEILRLQRTTDHADELNRRLSDKAPESWMSLAELKKKLPGDPDPR